MKKILLLASALAGMFFAASCQQENLEPVQAGQQVTFTIEAPAAMQTKAIADGQNVNQLVYEVWLTPTLGNLETDAQKLYRATAPMTSDGTINKAELKTFITLLNPFAPHVTEEMWEQLGFEGMLNQTSWPSYDEAKCVDNEIEIAVQINGKVREKLVIAAEATQEEALAAAKALDKIAEAISGMTIVKELYVKGRLVNIVVRP